MGQICGGFAEIDFKKFAFFPVFSLFFAFFHKNDHDLTLFDQK